MERSVDESRARALRDRLLSHYDRHRRDLPWRAGSDPYAIWVSEVMLQQTRVATATRYYRRWMERFPTLDELADADPDEVLAAWSGLGYYRRARDLHRAARIVRDGYRGKVPADPALLRGLPGIGPYTAGAIASIAFGRPVPAVDGNTRRVLSRVFDLEGPSDGQLMRLAGALVPAERPGDFNQALMELGATLCRPRDPTCKECPLAKLCLARRRGTTAARPGRRAARALPKYVIGTAVIVSGCGRALLARRPEEGLLGGMWEFPGAVTTDGECPLEAARHAARRLLGSAVTMRMEGGFELIRVRHAFSHRRHVYHAHRFRLVGDPDTVPSGLPRRSRSADTGAIPAWTAAQWVPVPRLESRPLPAAQRRIARALV